MEHEIIEVGSFGVNCSIIVEYGKAWVVDPGAEAPRILAAVAKRGVPLAGILLTHAHFDHIGAIPAILDAWPQTPVYVDEKDVAVLTHPLNEYPPEYPAIGRPPVILAPEVCPLPFEAIRTPGHTPGGVSYYFRSENLLLSGDTLFAGSFGRTDLPGGDFAQLASSLRRLCELPEETRVLPGHGPATTIGAERRNLRGVIDT